MVSGIVEKMEESYVIREEAIGDDPAAGVLQDRLAKLPVPELVLLAAYILDDESDSKVAASGMWLAAVRDELGIEESEDDEQ